MACMTHMHMPQRAAVAAASSCGVARGAACVSCTCTKERGAASRHPGVAVSGVGCQAHHPAVQLLGLGVGGGAGSWGSGWEFVGVACRLVSGSQGLRV